MTRLIIKKILKTNTKLTSQASLAKGQKNRLCTKPFEYTVLGSYFMKINDILIKWILKTYSMWEKYVQIRYSSINNSKIHPKLVKPPDRMSDLDGLSPLHPYYSRDYRSTSHMRAKLAKDWWFSRSTRVCFRMCLRSQGGVSNSWKIMIFHHVWVKKKCSWAKSVDHTVLSL